VTLTAGSCGDKSRPAIMHSITSPVNMKNDRQCQVHVENVMRMQKLKSKSLRRSSIPGLSSIPHSI
jgi:hypothetical protein